MQLQFTEISFLLAQGYETRKISGGVDSCIYIKLIADIEFGYEIPIVTIIRLY